MSCFQFLPLFSVLILLSGVNYDSTTDFALVVVDGYLGCKKGIDTRHQIGCNLPASSLAVLFMNELPRALIPPAYSDLSAGQPTSSNISFVGLVERESCPLLTLMTEKTTSWYEDRQLLARSNDQIMRLWLVSSKLSNWMAYRAGILAQLTPQIALRSIADGLPEDSKGICCSSDSSCADDIATVAGCDSFQTSSLDGRGEDQVEFSDSAAAAERKNLWLSPVVGDTDSCKVSFLYAGSSFSTEEYYWPVLDMFTSDVERRPFIRHGLNLLNNSTTSSRDSVFTEEKRRELFEYLMKPEHTTVWGVRDVLSIVIGFIFFTFVQLAVVAYCQKPVLSSLKEVLFLTRVNMDKCNETNETLAKVLMVTKSSVEVRDNELNEMKSLIKSLTTERRQMQENIECLLKDQSVLRQSVDAMKQERDEACRREVVHQNEVKRLDTYVEKLLLAVLSNHPDLLQRQQ